MNKRPLRRVVIETALAVMDARGHDPEVRRQVDALIGSLDDTLPDERILQELEALKPGAKLQQILTITSGRDLPRHFPSLGSR